MKTESDSLLANAANITVVNDGQVRYPVLTADLTNWVTKNGAITDENYEQFCAEVDYLGAEVGTPGNAGMIDLCRSLVEAGADLEQLG